MKEICFAKVRETKPKGDQILVPLCPVGDTHFSATIAYDLHQLGVPLKVVRQYNDVAERNSMKRIVAYIETHGRLIRGPIVNPIMGRQTYEIVPAEPTQRPLI